MATGFLAAIGGSPAQAQTFDRFVLIQPIQVCDGAGNCGEVQLRHAGTAQTFLQAGVLPIYLPLKVLTDPTEYDVSQNVPMPPMGSPVLLPHPTLTGATLYEANRGPLSFLPPQDFEGEPLPSQVLSMWFTGPGSIFQCGGTLTTTTVGCANSAGLIIIDGDFNANTATDNGEEHNLIAHEMGHTFDLGHTDPANTQYVMNPTVQVAQFNTIGDTTFLFTDSTPYPDDSAPPVVTNVDDINQIRTFNAGAGLRAQSTFADNCDDGDGDGNAITVEEGTACLNLAGEGGNDSLILEAGSGVLQDVTGNAGNDMININAGAIVGKDVTGGSGLDTLIIGGLVMNSVDSGSDDDTVMVLSGAEVISRVDGGSGNDLVSIQGKVGAGNFADAAPGTGTPTIAIVMAPSQVRGGTGNDTVLIRPGATIAGSVFGDDNDDDESDDGNDTMTMTGGQVIGNIDGEGGNDTITIEDGVVRRFRADAAGTGTIFGGNVLGGGGNDTITMKGGRVAGNVDGEGNNDIIDILGGRVFGHVLGGGGNDKIRTAEPGTVSGNVDGGAGDDELTIASDPSNIFGGIGNDTVTLNAGTIVTNSVFGDDGNGDEGDGDGNDTITMNAGSVGLDVDGEGGNDTINILGGSIGRHVLGGGGVDKITLKAGTITGSVRGEEGTDTIELNGTVVSGNLDGGDDADTINIFSGSALSVFGGSGNDIAKWTGGTLAGSIDMGGDTDTLDIYGAGAAGAALQAGLSALDGGAGTGDTMNLRGVQEVLTTMLNWEFINLINNSIGNLGAVSRSTTVEQFYVDSGSTLVARNGTGAQVYEFVGSLKNEGIVDMQDGAGAYDELSITNIYTGGADLAQASLLRLDTFLGAGSLSDLLRVGTSTAGVTGLSIFDTNALGSGVYNPIGIELVRVEGAAGQTQKEHVNLIGGPIEKDLWIFDHALDDTRSNPGRANADVHVLYSRPSDVVQFTPYFATGALTVFNGSLEPWIDRQHALSNSVARETAIFGSHSDQALVAFSDPPGTAARSMSMDIWLTPFGTHRSENSISTLTFFGDTFTANMDYSQGVYGIQGGIDFISDMGNGSAVMAGLFGGYVNSTIVPDEVSVRGKYSGGTVGGYANYMNGGFMLSGVVKADLLGFDWQAPMLGLATTADVTTIGGRVEAAYKHFVLGGNGWLEPFTNITHASSNWDQFSFAATTFDLSGNQSTLGRLGLRVGADIGDGQTSLKVYAGAGVAYEFDELNTASVLSGGSTLPLTHVLDTTALELQGGVKWSDASNGVSFGINTSSRLSKSAQEYGGKATVNLNF